MLSPRASGIQNPPLPEETSSYINSYAQYMSSRSSLVKEIIERTHPSEVYSYNYDVCCQKLGTLVFLILGLWAKPDMDTPQTTSGHFLNQAWTRPAEKIDLPLGLQDIRGAQLLKSSWSEDLRFFSAIFYRSPVLTSTQRKCTDNIHDKMLRHWMNSFCIYTTLELLMVLRAIFLVKHMHL